MDGSKGERDRRRVAVAAVGLAALSATAGIAGTHLYSALFTDAKTASPTFGSGNVTLASIGVNGANQRLSVGAGPLAAGDTIERAVDLQVAGSLTVGSVTLTTSASTSSLLDTDATDGLQLVIERCSQAWTETSNAGGAPFTYTCGGTTATALASRAVIGANLTLSNLDLSANAHNYMRVTVTLPSAAGNTLQSQTSVIDFTFAAVQRAGQSM